MSSCAKALIRLKFSTEKQLTTLLNALGPEANSPPAHRAFVKLERDGSFLVMSVEAKDTVALRATLNAFLRWINSTLSIIDILDNKQL